jgi:hypothetical protein
MQNSGAQYAHQPAKLYLQALTSNLQGLELDESDRNPFANTDGFYPVCLSQRTVLPQS